MDQINSDICTIEKIETSNNFEKKMKVRIISKQRMRQFTYKQTGKVFGFIAKDSTGEIKFTAFNNVAEQFYNIIKVNKIYTLTNLKIRTAASKYNHHNNKFEIFLKANTIITECPDEPEYCQLEYNFIPISQINDLDEDTLIDVIGIITDIKEIEEVKSTTQNKTFKKKEIVIIDNTDIEITVTLWNQDTEDQQIEKRKIIAIQKGKLNDFLGTKSISITISTNYTLNPQLTDFKDLNEDIKIWLTETIQKKPKLQ